MTTINIAEGKLDFSRLIRESVEKEDEVIVTRRGTPVAVLISYDAYKRLKREEGYRRIMRARNRFTAGNIKAEDVYAESKEQLKTKL
ncbi:MAG: type II toxin-antitoxin system Phd/YefM family antitoxin [Desulfobacterales bacterium]|nr:type II toxin-antitoxin system Phd/YefM family antitoxin [Desulfobacterales bacterium]